jgi:ribosomal-protein-alanine N-acetyltransferase
MSPAAQPPASPATRVMTVADLDGVMAVETQAYGHPWSRGNFTDSLAAGHVAEVLHDAQGQTLLGYFVAMPGVQELHLLNITVAPAHQHQGWGLMLLRLVRARARARRLGAVWLEVRAGNARARAIYRDFGFVECGTRRGYYPASASRREDAVVMSLELPEGVQDAAD